MPVFFLTHRSFPLFLHPSPSSSSSLSQAALRRSTGTSSEGTGSQGSWPCGPWRACQGGRRVEWPSLRWRWLGTEPLRVPRGAVELISTRANYVGVAFLVSSLFFFIFFYFFIFESHKSVLVTHKPMCITVHLWVYVKGLVQVRRESNVYTSGWTGCVSEVAMKTPFSLLYTQPKLLRPRWAY